MTSSYDVMWSSWELVYGDFRLKGVIWACIHSNFRSYLNRFWVMDPLSRTPLTSYFGRHLENRWVKIIFGAGNEFSDPNYMEKVTSHEKIDWLVVLGSNFDLFWRPFWKYRFLALCVKIQLGIRQKSILRTKLPLEPVSKVFHTLHAKISTPVPAYYG